MRHGLLLLSVVVTTGAAQAQNVPLLRIDPSSLAVYRQAEPLDRAGDDAGVIEAWRARAQAGDDLALFETGVVLMRSPAASPEAKRGLEMVRRSAEAGYVRAQLRLYFLYRHGTSPLVQPDAQQALAWLRRAADQNFATALVHLGLAHEAGYGVERSSGEAFKLFQRAAGENHPFGHFALAAAYESGIGVAVDLDKARASYEKAIERATWLQTRPNVAYVYRPIYEKWIVDAKAALAGLDQAVVAKRADDARLAEERRLEAENTRVAAERKRAEESRVAEERQKLEAEQARIAEERRRLEAENARLAAERKRAEDAQQALIAEERRRAAENESRPRAAAAPQRQEAENDLAMSFGRFVRGLATGVQVTSGVAAAVRAARAGDEKGFSQGLGNVAAVLSPSAPAAAAARPAEGARTPQGTSTGNAVADCEAGLERLKAEFNAAQPRAQGQTVPLLESQIRLYAGTIALINRHCPNEPKYSASLGDLQRRLAQARDTCARVAAATCRE